MLDQLKPCPFCGARLEVDRGRTHAANVDVYRHPVTPEPCPAANFVVRGSAVSLLAAWNRRAGEEV